jgi:hypothetical protein
VQRVAVVFERHPQAGFQHGDVDVVVDVHHVLPLGVHLRKREEGRERDVKKGFLSARLQW